MDMFIEVLNKSNNSPSFYSLRQGTVCGFGPRMRFDLVVNKMIKDAILYKKIHTIDKNIRRPILDISDASAVYDKIINNKVPKGIYNVYSYNITVDQIAKKIQKFLEIDGNFLYQETQATEKSKIVLETLFDSSGVSKGSLHPLFSIGPNSSGHLSSLSIIPSPSVSGHPKNSGVPA